MKILVINTSPAFYDGISNVIKNINNSINKDNLIMDILVVTEPPESFVCDAEKNNSKIFYLERSIKKIIPYIIELYKILRENYSVVHIHGNSHTTIIELMVAWFAGCKTRIVHAHNTYCKEKIIHSLATPLFNLLCTDRLACGYEAGKFMHGNHKFEIINNGIDVKRFSYKPDFRNTLRDKYGLEHKYVIGHVGTLYNGQKNQMFLIDIMEKLVIYSNKYHLVLIGSGIDRMMIENKIKEKGLSDYITMLGAVEDVSYYLSLFDFITMPSFYEGLPLSLIEEQANGLQCIVSDKITKEVDKTGNLIFLPINIGVEIWVENILNLNLDNRELSSILAIESIKKSGYDIYSETEKLKRIYLKRDNNK